MMWLVDWFLLSIAVGLEIGRAIAWGNPTPSEPEPVEPKSAPVLEDVR